MSYETEFKQRTPEGYRLFEHRWMPDGVPVRGVVVFVHGIVEHAGRYTAFAERLNKLGLVVRAYDLRGHGRSEGPRVYVRSFSEHIGDLDRFISSIREEQSDLPFFLMGHSMGGAIASRWVVDNNPDINGLILSAPAVLTGRGALPWFRHLALIGNIVCPQLKVLKLGVGGLSRDPAVREEFAEDPLVYHEKFAVRMGIEVLKAGRYLRHRLELIRVPVLGLHGTKDLATNPRGTRALCETATSDDATFISYEGFYHDLLHEPDREQVLGDIESWIIRRLPS
jgi:acylglycerol lipase